MSGCSARTSLDQPLPERQRLGVRVVDAEDPDAVLAPVQDDVEQRLPEPAPVLAVPVDVVDVLVLLGRVLGVLQRAVGAAVEPLGVLGQPRVVGAALDGEVQRDVDAVVAGDRDEAVEVRRSCRARGGSRRGRRGRGGRSPTASRGRRGRRPARCWRPCGWSRRSGGSAAGRATSKPSSASARDGVGDAAQPAPRAREELVPGAEARPLAVDVDLERARRSRCRPCPGQRSAAAATPGSSAAATFARQSAVGVGDRVAGAGAAAWRRRPWRARPPRPRGAAAPSLSSPPRSSWPASTLRRSSSRQEANGSLHASTENCQVPQRSTANSPAQRLPPVSASVRCIGALGPPARRPGRGGGRPRAGPRGRRGRRRPRPPRSRRPCAWRGSGRSR